MRRLFTLLTGRRSLLAAVLVGAASCGGGDSTGNTTVASVRFVQQPTNVAAGEVFTVTVELLNPDGARATGSRASVLLRITGSATLQGTTTVEAVQGVATFDDVSVTTAVANLQLQAEAATFSTSSNAFTVAAGPATGAQSTAAAAATPISPYEPTEITFTFKDGFNNPIRQAAVAVSSSQAGSSFNPASGTTGSDGTFASAFQPNGEGNVTFSAVVAGTSISITSPVAVSDPCPPSPMVFPGIQQGAVPAGSCAVEGRPAAAYRFTTAAGGVSFAVGSAFPPLVEVQTDPPGSNVRIQPAADMQAVEWLLPAGTFRFRVATLSSPGTFSVTSAAVPANTGQVIRVLVAAGTFGGQVLDDTDVPFGDGSFIDFYYLYSTRPCTVTLRSAAFDAYLFLVNPNTGQALAEDDDAGGGTDALASLPACNAGSGLPLLVAANHWPGMTGGYTLTVAFPSQVAARAGAVTAQREITVRADKPAIGSLARKPKTR
jgi:hypothetical protein